MQNENQKRQTKPLDLERESVLYNARTKLLHFIKFVNPKFVINWHHVTIANYLMRLLLPKEDPNHIRGLCVSMMPRIGKSTLISIYFPCFFFGYMKINPLPETDETVIAASGKADLAKKFCRAIKDIMQSEAYKELFPQIELPTWKDKTKANNQNQIEFVSGGHYKITSPKGSVTGWGASLLISDDLIENRQAAESEAVLTEIMSWYDSAFSMRADGDARFIHLSTRWSTNDPISQILDKAKKEPESIQYEVLNFPALVDVDNIGDLHPDDPRKNPDRMGEALWEWKVPLKKLKEKRATLPSKEWMALYQGDPKAASTSHWGAHLFGGMLRKSIPYGINAPSSVLYLDPATGESNKKGDYSAVTFLARDQEEPPNLYADCFIERCNVERLLNEMVKMAKKYNPDCIGVEKNGFQFLLKILLVPKLEAANLSMPVITINNSVNKDIRIQGLTTWIESFRLYIQESQYSDIAMHQLKEYPNATHDDFPDSLAGALKLLTYISNQKVEDEENKNSHYFAGMPIIHC